MRISKAYDRLCADGEVPEIQRATKYIESIREKIERLVKVEQSRPDWAELGRDLSLVGKRKNKRLWSGGFCRECDLQGDQKDIHPLAELSDYCENIKSGEEAVKTRWMKILNYSQISLVVYSRHALELDKPLALEMYFNSIDLPFTATVKVVKEIGAADLPAHRQRFMTRQRIPYCYLMNFDRKPEPTYYFLSMCKGLFEEQREWDTDPFDSMFCADSR